MVLSDLSKWIEEIIINHVNTSPNNTLGDGMNEKAWGSPMIGFSKGDDPLYSKIRDDIGSFYWTPADIFKLTYPEAEITAEELTVISWILPQTEVTKLAQRVEQNYPSKHWALSRVNGQAFNDELGRLVVEILRENNYSAVCPSLSPFWENKRSERYGYASSWSERHVAFVSGLGTFGLCDGLITPLGKAVRCGSVVARIKVPATRRNYEDYNEYCLYFSRGLCRKCIARCPVGAITIKGHDKIKCREYQNNITRKHTREQYNIESGCCGLCQTKVPCESGIPLKMDSLKRV